MTYRRITERLIMPGEALLANETGKAAALITGLDRHGVIAGVHVDLRHEDLPAHSWEPLPQWYVCGPSPTHAGIMFPAEAASTSQAERDELAEAGISFVEALPGDRVTVETVIPEITDRRFDHEHDAQWRRAYLSLERSSGEVLHPSGPLGFFGATIIRNGPTREAFDHILARICLHTDTNLQEMNGRRPSLDWQWSDPLEEIALQLGTEAHSAYFRVLEELPVDSPARAALRRLANHGSLAGFLLAKAEARRVEKAARGTENQPKAVEGRINWQRRSDAGAAWHARPKATSYEVAKRIAKPGEDVEAVRKSIMKLAPMTSPSHPDHPDNRSNKRRR